MDMLPATDIPPGPRPGAARAARPNVVLVTVDCMRRDRLSAYGYARETTPFLDRLLERSLHCTSAHSVSCWTCPAVASLLTGLYPHRHGAGLVPGSPKNLSKENLPTKLPAEVTTLPELLAARGYATAAMIAVWNAHLPIPGRFQHLDMAEKPASKMVARALRWIRAQDGPFFLWLHLGDPHEPLDVPRSMRRLFGPVRVDRKTLRWAYTKRSERVDTPAFEEYRASRVGLYDLSIRAVDAALAELWDGVQATRSSPGTLFMVTADHGEEFWEHREEEMAGFLDPRDVAGTGHGHNLFQVHLLVPLVLAGPGIDPGAVERNVSLVDVAPTLLQACGVDGPPADGRSLLDLDGERPVLAEGIAYGYEKRAVVMGDLKLLAAPEDGYERLFRLGSDRRESGALDDAGEAGRLRDALPEGRSAMGEQVQGDEEISRHLRALGYIE